MSETLAALARLYGVVPYYHDVGGRRHDAGPDTQAALLDAMGVPVGSEAEAREALEARQAEVDGRRLLPHEVVARPDRPLGLSLAEAQEWRITLEGGDVVEGKSAIIDVSPPPGLHRLHVGDDMALLIAAPLRAPSVSARAGASRVWGVTTSLYGLHSERSFGVGDFADLAGAARRLGAIGADFIGINPVHARGSAYEGVSPYSPTSRIALEGGHIAPDQIEQAEPRLAALEGADLAPLREGDRVLYEARDAAVDPILRASHAEERRSAYADWRALAPEALKRFAIFEALSLEHGANWREWPEPFRDPLSRETLAFAEENAHEVDFHLWLQWIAEKQLDEAQAAARAGGMRLGLYLDLAVGVRPDGADVWARPEAFAHGVSLGAPPDPLAPDGQSWGLAPFSPEGLRKLGYLPFLETLRSALKRAGVIRIDHVIGLMQAFWQPDSGAPGGYVRYPLDTMLALVRLEARRTGAVVVGEDLGTVPEGLRKKLGESGLLGCTVMQFERGPEGFHDPAQYHALGLASFGTHDTPTLKGWVRAREADWREEVGQFDHDRAEAMRRERVEEVRKLDRRLGVPEGADDETRAEAAYRALAESPAELAALSLEDALGEVEQPNLPGTTEGHPNWRRRLKRPVETLTDAPLLRRLADVMSAARPRPERSSDG